MYLVSCRKDFKDADGIGATIWNFEGNKFDNTEMEQAAQYLANKKVLFLVHGYNTDYDEVIDSYMQIETNYGHLYDAVIGFLWPGNDEWHEFFKAYANAQHVGTVVLPSILKRIHKRVKHMDVMSHSLGAMVVLSSVSHWHKQFSLKNFFCMAGAVPFEYLMSLQDTIKNLPFKRIHALYSREDMVLEAAFTLAKFTRALGYDGFQSGDNKPRKCVAVDCSEVVPNHSGYKHAPEVRNYVEFINLLDRNTELPVCCDFKLLQERKDDSCFPF